MKDNSNSAAMSPNQSKSPKPAGSGSTAKPSPSGGHEATTEGKPDGCVNPDGTFSFEYDKVVHSHNYQDIRDIPTGGYVKSNILRKFDPADNVVNMSKK